MESYTSTPIFVHWIYHFPVPEKILGLWHLFETDLLIFISLLFYETFFRHSFTDSLGGESATGGVGGKHDPYPHQLHQIIEEEERSNRNSVDKVRNEREQEKCRQDQEQCRQGQEQEKEQFYVSKNLAPPPG